MFSVHPVVVHHVQNDYTQDYELLFMSEDDAFEFAQQITEKVSVLPSISLHETPEEAMAAFKRMIGE